MSPTRISNILNLLATGQFCAQANEAARYRNRPGRLEVATPSANQPDPTGNSLRPQDRMEGLIEQHLPPLRKTRHRNLARLLTGLHLFIARSTPVCRRWPTSFPAQQTSKTRRMRRFVNSENLFGGLLRTAYIQQKSAGQRLVNETNPFTRPTQSDDLSVSL
jgi:hypothetical protein